MSQGEPSLVTHRSVIGLYSKGSVFGLYCVAVVELSAPPCICFSVHTHLAGCDHDLCFDSGLRKAGEFQCLSEFDKFIPDLDLFFHLFDLFLRIPVFRDVVVLSGTQFAMPTGSQTLRFLLAVAAFAVYRQPVKCSFVSKLPTSIRRPVCAWLIAIAQIQFFELSWLRVGRNDP